MIRKTFTKVTGIQDASWIRVFKLYLLILYRDLNFIFPYVITEDTLGISGYHGHLHQQSLARNGFLCCRNPKDHFKTETKSMFSY